MAENTAFLMREANTNLYNDRRVLRKIVEDEYKIRGAIDKAHFKVVEIERIAFIRKCVMYGITVGLGILIFLLILKKLVF
jgi:hypothetical protein